MLRLLTIALVASVAFAEPVRRSSRESSYSMTEYIQAFTTLYKSNSCQQTIEKPTEVQAEKIQIRVYRGDSYKTSDMNNCQDILKAPEFMADQETKIFIHGWLQQDQVEQNIQLAQLYALRGKKINMISIDWSEYACLTNFDYTAEHHVQELAAMVGNFMQTIQKICTGPMHMIGFDMGAHMAGVAAKKTDKKVDRITALSPAGRCFEQMPASNKLAKGDAKYIDVINTNHAGAGYSNNLGDINFLPNGGRQQPLAEITAPKPIRDALSHMASIAYFLESVELGHRGFIAKQCDSWQDFQNNKCASNPTEIMGEFVSQKLSGTFYLNVAKGGENQYYSKGIYGLYQYDY